ncbi:MAG TPA: trypsin-like peptidase domain-containing protein [Galbitalea sp.]
MSIENENQQAPTEPAPEVEKKNRKPLIAIAIATAAVVCIGGLGTAAIAMLTTPTTSATSAQTSPQRGTFGQYGQGFGRGYGGGFGQGQSQGRGGSQQGLGNSAASSVSEATAATAAQKVGVVTIDTTLDYNSQEQAAGTGMILSSSGLILTNNHVVEQSTAISVTVESTNKTYKAVVVGTDAKADVAVLKLVGASGLSTVTFDAAEKVAVGDAIHSVGNAEGTGNLVTATGTVGAVNQNLTVQSDYSTTGESLTGLIELKSDVVSGDSGGPLFDKNGDVIGIVTAASSGSANVTGYAINIAQVLKVVDQIESGTATTDIVIGNPAFLGVSIASTSTSVTGVPVASAFAGMPAASVGIAEGSVITAVDGVSVTTADALSAAIASHQVGNSVTIAWTDAAGAAHSSVVTLVGGPAA